MIFTKPIVKLIKDYKGFNLWKRWDEHGEHYKILSEDGYCRILPSINEDRFEEYVDAVIKLDDILGRR